MDGTAFSAASPPPASCDNPLSVVPGDSYIYYTTDASEIECGGGGTCGVYSGDGNRSWLVYDQSESIWSDGGAGNLEIQGGGDNVGPVIFGLTGVCNSSTCQVGYNTDTLEASNVAIRAPRPPQS